MEVSRCCLLLLLAGIYVARGDLEAQESRLYRRLESFCGKLEDFENLLAKKRASLEENVVYLRLLADDVHKAHTDATEDKVFWSGVSVSGHVINMAGLALEYMEKGSPYIAALGIGLSTVGGYFQEKVCASEQEQWHMNEKNVGRMFGDIEEDLQEITNLDYEIKEKLRDLEEEEGLLGTRLHKKLLEIKMRFSRFTPSRIEQRYIDMRSQLFDMVLKLAVNTGAIASVGENVASKVFTGGKHSMPDGASGKNMAGVSGTSRVVVKNNQFSHSKYAFKAFTAAASLYQDGKKLYKGILHLNKGARSDLAENVREVAVYLESVIQKLDRFLPKKEQPVRDI